MEFNTFVPCGWHEIEVKVVIDSYRLGEPDRLSGHPDSWEEGFDTEVEFHLETLKGFSAKLLEKVLGRDEWKALHNEAADFVEKAERELVIGE